MGDVVDPNGLATTVKHVSATNGTLSKAGVQPLLRWINLILWNQPKTKQELTIDSHTVG